MISSNTVFILGAGASMPYKFPSGLRLREILCTSLGLNASNNDIMGLLSKCAIDSRRAHEFCTEFRDSNVASIDAFLARRNEYAEIGKLAIAAAICNIENPRYFSSLKIEDHWYFQLWNAMLNGVHNYKSILNNEVKFITFNYDRSLEYFLYSSIKSAFNLKHESAYGLVNEMPIRHIYGQIGQFGIVGDDYFEYGGAVGKKELEIAAAGLKIIPESRDSDPVFEEVQRWLYDARYICFLGFGFDPLNVERLGFSRIVKAKLYSLPQIYTSGYGKTKSELNLYGKMVAAEYADRCWHPQFDRKNLETIRDISHLWA